MNNMPFMLLTILTAFTMNLTLQCGLGIKSAAESKKLNRTSALIKLSIIFSSIILLWLFFSRILFSISYGFYTYVILFPFCYIVYEGIEFLIFYFLLKKDPKKESFISFPGGITSASVFICLNLSDSLLETLVMALGFTAGILLVLLIIREIRRRAALEAVPKSFRGKPLVLITMGMVSFIFSTASLIILRIIGFR